MSTNRVGFQGIAITELQYSKWWRGSAAQRVLSRIFSSIKGLMADPPQNSEPESLREIVAEEKQEFAPPASKDSRLALAVRALRHRNFQLFFSGQLISLIGTWMQTVAESWLVYRFTGSGLKLGAVGFARQNPVFLIAPIGGIVADRSNRKHVVIGTQVASMLLAFMLAAVTLSHAVDHRVWMIF